MKIHFIDTETTGLDPMSGAEIVEIAIALWEDGNVTELLHKGYLPKNGCPEEAAKINGYNEAEWLAAGAQTFQIADAKELAELLAGAYIGGSNPDFDRRMIEAETFRTGQPKLTWRHRTLNTASLAWPLWALGEVEATGLETLAKHFKIEHEAHTAMGDVHATIKVWEALFDRYVHRPRVLEAALKEIESDEQTDAELRGFARLVIEGGWQP
jgi:DNA polymerase-3 subunit epsilon